MKNILFAFFSFFYPFNKFKDCSVKDKREREQNYRHNQENKGHLIDCALNCSYLFCWCLSFIYLLELQDPQKISIIFSFICGALGVASTLSFVMAMQMVVIYIFLGQERY